MKHDHYLSHKDEPYSKEGMEFEDPEFFQMTISKLKQELEEVNKECQYWKDAARNQVIFKVAFILRRYFGFSFCTFLFKWILLEMILFQLLTLGVVCVSL